MTWEQLDEIMSRDDKFVRCGLCTDVFYGRIVDVMLLERRDSRSRVRLNETRANAGLLWSPTTKRTERGSTIRHLRRSIPLCMQKMHDDTLLWDVVDRCIGFVN